MAFIVPPYYDPKVTTAKVATSYDLDILKVILPPKIIRTDYGPQNQAYCEFEFPNDGLYDFSQGFIEIVINGVNSQTGNTYVRFADYIGSVFERVYIGTDSEPLRTIEHFGQTRAWYKTHRDSAVERANQGFYMEGVGTQANRNGWVNSNKRYLLSFEIPELTQTCWPMDLLAEPLKLRFYWQNPYDCMEGDGTVAAGGLTFNVPTFNIHFHKIRGQGYIDYFRAHLKSTGALKFMAPMFLYNNAQWTTANQDIQFTRRASNINDFIFMLRKQADINNGLVNDKYELYYKDNLTKYQLEYNNVRYPEQPVDVSTADNLFAYMHLLRMLGGWDGGSGVPNNSTNIASGFTAAVGSTTQSNYVSVVNLRQHGEQQIVSGLNNKTSNQNIVIHLTTNGNPTTTYQVDMFALCDFVWCMQWYSSDGKVHLSGYF